MSEYNKDMGKALMNNNFDYINSFHTDSDPAGHTARFAATRLFWKAAGYIPHPIVQASNITYNYVTGLYNDYAEAEKQNKIIDTVIKNAHKSGMASAMEMSGQFNRNNDGSYDYSHTKIDKDKLDFNLYIYARQGGKKLDSSKEIDDMGDRSYKLKGDWKKYVDWYNGDGDEEINHERKKLNSAIIKSGMYDKEVTELTPDEIDELYKELKKHPEWLE